MKFYLIAGEASGDLHGSNLIKALQKVYPDATFRAWGGEKMEAAGATVVKHYRYLAIMGFKEVLLKIRTIIKNLAFCKEELLSYQPDAVIFIDFPGFNLRMAKFAKEKGLRTIYYISPQVWAWKANRVKKIKQYVDLMLVILPFEKTFYQKWDYPVEFVGHPLLDVVSESTKDPAFLTENQLSSEKPLVVLAPGSRKQEIKNMLPTMLETTRFFPNHQFVIAGAPSISADFYRQMTASFSYIPVLYNQTYQLFQYAEAGLVTSGTATLEAALFELPQIVCYKGGQISFFIAKKLVKVKYISLVNLIANRLVVKELIQGAFNKRNLVDELKALLDDGQRKKEIQADYLHLKSLLGNAGASERAAEAIFKHLS